MGRAAVKAWAKRLKVSARDLMALTYDHDPFYVGGDAHEWYDVYGDPAATFSMPGNTVNWNLDLSVGGAVVAGYDYHPDDQPSTWRRRHGEIPGR
jgi:hypothetical protein